MNFDDDLAELDDILAAADELGGTSEAVSAVLKAMLAGHPPPKRKRYLAEEYCDASDDFCFDEYARRVSTTFLRDHGTPYAPPEAPPEVMPDHGSVPEPDDIFADVAALEASQAAANDLDDILAAVDALDAGLPPYAPPEAVVPDHGSVPKPDPAPPRVPEPPVVRTPAIAEPAAPAPSDPFGGFASPPLDKLPNYQNVNATFLDLRIAPATPAAEALVDDLVGRLLEAEERRGARQRKRRESAQRQLRDAVGAITGNLLRAWAEDPPVAVYRSRTSATSPNLAAS